MRQENFNNLREKLTDDDIEKILEVIGYRCHVKTYNRLRSILKYSARSFPQYGIFERLMRENGEWSYCAGQSYTDELRTIRSILLK